MNYNLTTEQEQFIGLQTMERNIPFQTSQPSIPGSAPVTSVRSKRSAIKK
jgi:hypothetical protein